MRKVHLIGVCGTAMATVAVLLKERGLDVRGSDEHAYPPMSELLASHGIRPLEGYRAEHIADDLDLVVVGNAVSRGNAEVEAVLDRRMRYCSLPEIVREEFLWGARPIVVAGTHGKTTTSFMTAWALAETGADPGFLIGGVSRDFGTSGRLGAGGGPSSSRATSTTARSSTRRRSSSSTCRRSSSSTPSSSITRTSTATSTSCASRSGAWCGWCPAGAPAAVRGRRGSGGSRRGGALRRGDVRSGGRCGLARATCPLRVGRDGVRGHPRGRPVGRAVLPLLGAFNVRNALGALAAAVRAGAPPAAAIAALGRFHGVRRRLEARGVVRGVTVYDDFAHHPTAVRETLQALRASGTTGRLWAVFEPRSATACRRVFQGAFADALELADEVVVADVYRSTLPASERLSEGRLVADLTARGVAARHVPGPRRSPASWRAKPARAIASS